MRETAERMWTSIREWFAKMPRGRKIQLAVLTVLVIVLAIIAVSFLTRTQWVNLGSTGDPTNTAHVYTALEEMGIPHRAENGRIQVPDNRLEDARMRLINQGLLETTDFSMDILDGATGFGITDSHARLLADRQTGADIRTQLMRSDRIIGALVIVSSGETSPFRVRENTKHAAASIMLTLRSGDKLNSTEVQVVADVVRTAIPGIEYENINITDNFFTRYRIGDDAFDTETLFAQRELLETRLLNNFQEAVFQLLAPVYGFQNMRVQPYVRLNFDKVAVEKIEFEPPVPGELGGIVRTSEILREMSRRWLDAEGIPGTDSNNMGMGAPEYPWGSLDDTDMYRRAIDSNNYEINQTITQIERQEYVIEALSIGISINSDVEGVEEDFTEEVTDLVSKTIGTSPNNISVQFLPFTHEDTTWQDAQAAQDALERQAFNRWLLDTILTAVVILALGVMVMMLVRSVIRAVKPPPEPEPALIAAGPDGIDLLIDDEVETEEKEYEDVDLQTKSPGLEQIERFIDKDAASVAQLLRNWLSDE